MDNKVSIEKIIESAATVHPNDYKKEFDFADNQTPGEPFGFLRFAVFQTVEGSNVIVSDCLLSKELQQGIILFLSRNDMVRNKILRMAKFAERVTEGMPIDLALSSYSACFDTDFQTPFEKDAWDSLVNIIKKQ